VIGLEDIGDGEHQVERAFVVAAAADRAALQGIGELEEVELREPVTLLKGGKGVVLLIRKTAGTGRALGLLLEQ